jgi:hypothetical protein
VPDSRSGSTGQKIALIPEFQSALRSDFRG